MRGAYFVFLAFCYFKSGKNYIKTFFFSFFKLKIFFNITQTSLTCITWVKLNKLINLSFLTILPEICSKIKLKKKFKSFYVFQQKRNANHSLSLDYETFFYYCAIELCNKNQNASTLDVLFNFLNGGAEKEKGKKKVVMWKCNCE